MNQRSKQIVAALGVVLFAPFAWAQSEGDLRLQDGDNPRFGRVEIFHAGQWGTVCDDFWDDVDAGVACRQLGYDDGEADDFWGLTFVPGVDPIWMDNVACAGGEATLASCPFNGFGSHNCVHSEDAGAYCSGCPASPQAACQTGFQKAKLGVVEKAAGKEKLSFKMVKGPALTHSALGDPFGSVGSFEDPRAKYSLCIYDDADVLAGEVEVTGSPDLCGTKPCWRALGPSGFPSGLLYKDKATAEDGVLKLLLKAGLPGKTKIVLKGKNNAAKGLTNLPSIAPALAGSSHATVQFYTDEAACYTSTLTNVAKNDVTSFKGTN